MLKIVNLTFEYIKNTKVLRGLNGEFNNGLNIVFANRGEGKTTLLDLLLFPKKGQNSITLNGEILTKKLAKHEISALQSNWFISEKKTVKQNFEASLFENKLPKTLLSSVGFDEILMEKTSEISLENKFKIAVLRALKKTPSLLILDSPFHESCSEISLLQTLKTIIANYQSQVEKPLCVLLLSRPFNAEFERVSLLISGSIAATDSYENILNKPKSTLLAVNFARYKNNVYAKGTQNYYVDGNMVEIGNTHSGVVTRKNTSEMTVDFGSDELEIKRVFGYEIGDKISVDIKKQAVIKLADKSEN